MLGCFRKPKSGERGSLGQERPERLPAKSAARRAGVPPEATPLQPPSQERSLQAQDQGDTTSADGFRRDARGNGPGTNTSSPPGFDVIAGVQELQRVLYQTRGPAVVKLTMFARKMVELVPGADLVCMKAVAMQDRMSLTLAVDGRGAQCFSPNGAEQVDSGAESIRCLLNKVKESKLTGRTVPHVSAVWPPAGVRAGEALEPPVPSDWQILAKRFGLLEFLVVPIQAGDLLLGSLTVASSNAGALLVRTGVSVWAMLAGLVAPVLQINRYPCVLHLMALINSCKLTMELIKVLLKGLLPLLMTESKLSVVKDVRLAVVSSCRQGATLFALCAAEDDGHSELQGGAFDQGRTKSLPSPGLCKHNSAGVDSVQKFFSLGRMHKPRSLGPSIPGPNPMSAGQAEDHLDDLLPCLRVDLLSNCASELLVKRIPGRGTLLSEMMSEECYIFVPDVTAYINILPQAQAELLLEGNSSSSGLESVLLMPIYDQRGILFGAVYFCSPQRANLRVLQESAENLLELLGPVVKRKLEELDSPTMSAGTQVIADGDSECESDSMTGSMTLSRSSVCGSQGGNEGVQPAKPMVRLLDGKVSLSAMRRMYDRVVKSRIHKPVCQLSDCKIGPLIGSGAYGEVFAGAIFGVVRVAVKLMRVHDDSCMLDVTRMALEMAAMANINHPNIVRVYAFFDSIYEEVLEDAETGRQYSKVAQAGPDMDVKDTSIMAVMELCQGGHLMMAIENGCFHTSEPGTGAMIVPDMELILQTLIEQAAALEYLHGLGIIHCDLKPQNILMQPCSDDPRGFVTKLTDLGLARILLGAPSIEGDTAGTPTHTAPEIVKYGRNPGVKTTAADVYAFGIIMWELYTKQPAFAGISPKEMLKSVVLKGMRPQFPHGTPLPYQALAKACWRKDPEQRPEFGEIRRKLYAMNRRLLSTKGRAPFGSTAAVKATANLLRPATGHFQQAEQPPLEVDDLAHRRAAGPAAGAGPSSNGAPLENGMRPWTSLIEDAMSRPIPPHDGSNS